MAKPIINIKFLADLKQFSSQMQNVNRSLAKTGKKMQSLGTSLSVGITAPLTALAVVSVKSFDTQAKAIAQVEAGLKSTGNAVGFTTEQLLKQASALQNNTLFGDEVILKDATAQLLTFTNIAGQQFSRTQEAALDLATRLDGDLKSASIQLGKALNDPIANLSALSRSGIQFSKEQKASIKTLWETGRAAEAQTLILDELEKQYGGSASAAAKAGTGPLTQLKNILGDITEEFGAIIIEGINPFVEKLKAIALSFQSLSPTTKKWIVILGGVASAIGPLLALAGTILPAIGTGLALLTGPIGLVVAGLTAVGVVIYKNWKPIKKTLVDIANYFIDLYNESLPVKIAVEAIALSFKNMYSVASFVFETIGSIITNFISQTTTGFKALGKVVKGALTFDYDLIKEGIADAFKGSKNNVKTFVDSVKGDFENLKTNISGNINEAIDNVTTRKKIKFLKENVDASAVTEAVSEATTAGLTTTPTTTAGGSGGREQETALDLTGLAQGVDLDFEPITEQTDNLTSNLENLQSVASIVGESVGSTFQNLSSRIVDSLGLANTGFQGFVKGLISTVTQLIAMMLSQSIAQSIAGATASGTATGPAAVFTTPAFIATAVSGVLGAFASIPKFADGGIVSGPTYALVGEYAGASNNPEVIAPLDKLKDLIQPAGGNLTVGLNGEFRLDGQDLVLAVDRVNSRNSRTS